MRELGIDLAAQRPQKLTEQLATGAFLIVTMGCGDECPHVPGLKRDDWPLDDPKGQPLKQVRRIRDEVHARVAELVDHYGGAGRHHRCELGPGGVVSRGGSPWLEERSSESDGARYDTATMSSSFHVLSKNASAGL